MSDIIHLLPDSVANQIAAGEVITRPASVLKELVENAIDAGATEISIAVTDAGRSQITITDNGKGMSETDARMAFERHATSKIGEATDLYALHTLGFRGEALASIAAVAQVELRTRRAEDELGTYIEIAGSRVFKQESTQCAVGATFAVKNLFFNLPARRRFLKSDNVENNHLLQEFYRVALVYNEVTFSYYCDHNLLFQVPAASIKTRIEQIFAKSAKKRWEQQLLSLEAHSTLISISGFIGRPEYASRHPNQYFFVNGRYMRHPFFHKAVMLAYERLIPAGEGPNYFIYFQTAPENIDINIHPTKTEIKFESENAVFSILQSAVKETLGKFNIVPSIDFDMEGAVNIPPTVPSAEGLCPPQISYNPAYNPFSASTYAKRPPALGWEKLYEGFEKEKHTDKNTTIFTPIEPSSENCEWSQQNVVPYHIQVKNRYILTALKSGLLLIDQQRAHTRILFERFMRQLHDKSAVSQRLIFPEEMQLTADEALFFRSMLKELAKAGFEIHETQENRFEISGTPSEIGAMSVVALLLSLLDKSRQTDAAFGTEDMHKCIALSLAEASCIKAGQTLSPEEMADVIDRLFACSENTYAPDGKKIIAVIAFDELEERLK